MHEDARRSIDRFYHPKTVALIGVSGSFGFGHGLPRFLIDQGWGDRIYPVNPKVEEIEGIRAYPSVRDVPEAIELACIMVPSQFVEEVLRDCVAKGVKAVIVMSAGFAETGPEGKKRQDSLTAIAREAGIRMIGPNCIGVVDVPNGFGTTEILLKDIQPGNISIVAQSGVFGNILLDGAPAQGVRIAKVATIGNRADLDETDFLAYYGDDPDTGVIVLYMESIRRGRDFLETVRDVSRKKPVLAYLGGQTEAGRKADEQPHRVDGRFSKDGQGRPAAGRCLDCQGSGGASRDRQGLLALSVAQGKEGADRDGFGLSGRDGCRSSRGRGPRPCRAFFCEAVATPGEDAAMDELAKSTRCGAFRALRRGHERRSRGPGGGRGAGVSGHPVGGCVFAAPGEPCCC